MATISVVLAAALVAGGCGKAPANDSPKPLYIFIDKSGKLTVTERKPVWADIATAQSSKVSK
jgi:hypothetical protein